MVRIAIALHKWKCYFNSLLKYFRGYWQTTKIFLSNICNNEIIPDKNFPDYGITSMVVEPYVSRHYQLHSQLSAVYQSNRCEEKTITFDEVNPSRLPFSNCWCKHHGAAIYNQWKQVCNCFPRSVYKMANGICCNKSESTYFISEGDSTHVQFTGSFTPIMVPTDFHV